MHGGNAVLCSHSPVFFTNIGQTMSLLLTRRADLVAMPGGPHPIPSRTRPLSPPGPMVLRLKAWESRSLPGLPGACANAPYDDQSRHGPVPFDRERLARPASCRSEANHHLLNPMALSAPGLIAILALQVVV